MTPIAMKLVWVLVVYSQRYVGASLDPSTGNITMPPPIRVELSMASKEMCEQVAALNSNTASCWAHEENETMKDKP